jgi:hypothetical protein
VEWLTEYGVPVASFDHNVVRAALALDTLELAAADDITAMAALAQSGHWRQAFNKRTKRAPHDTDE